MPGNLADLQFAVDRSIPTQMLIRNQPCQLLAGANDQNVAAIRTRPVFVHGFLVFHS